MNKIAINRIYLDKNYKVKFETLLCEYENKKDKKRAEQYLIKELKKRYFREDNILN